MAGADEYDTENHNGKVEPPSTPSSAKSTMLKPLKIKVEVIADDEHDEEDVVVDKNRQKDHCHNNSKAISTSADGQKSPIRKRETDDDVADGGRVGSRRGSSDNADDTGMFSGAVENEDAGSDDLSHDRYSPFEGMCENSENDDFSPIQDQSGNVVLEVDCGSNSALLYVNKLCQGSKGQCILFEDRWYTPNEYQFISGRETAKDWKRSIRHRGKSLKILMGRGLLRAHPLMCECDTCRLNFASKGLRIADRRGGTVSSSSTSSNGSLAMVDRSRLRRTAGPDGEGGHLNDIIDQLQHSNNNGYSNGNIHHVYDSGRKRSLGVDNVSPTGSSPSSMPCGLALVKRPRSVSPRDDDIYDEQQRKIFEAANSPEPQNIENLRRSLNLGSSRSNSPLSGDRSSSSTGSHPSFYGSHGNGRNAPTVMVAASVNSNSILIANGAGPADLSRHSSTSPTSGARVTPTGLLLSQAPQMMVKHQPKSRKQTAPQHLDVGNHGDETHAHRAAHIVLSSYSGQQYKANAAVRPRYQSTPVYNHRSTTNSSTNHHATGSSGELNLSTNGGSRRTHSTMTPATRSPSQRAPGTPVKMIELTRPEIVPSSSSGYSSRPSSTHSSSTPGEEGRSHTPVHSSIGNTDAVFLPSDITSWSISDVTHFVQSLKGCEDYSQVFREQAIDGEILPVLTEDHLLHNMGLKLGPALKIRLHVARRLGFTLDGQYCNTIIPPPPPPQLLPPPSSSSSSSSVSQESTGTAAPPGPSTPGPASQKPAGEVFAEDV